MKQLFLYLIVCLCALSACNNYSDEPEPTKNAERTVVVWMAGENSLYRFCDSDSAEIAQAANLIPKNVNFVLYRDDTKLPSIYTITAKKGVQLWKKYKTDQDSADSTVLRNSLREIMKAYPATHYSFVFWSHGSGWAPRRKTIGIDNNQNGGGNTGNSMQIPELRWALEQSVGHCDYILFDACFMQNVEVAYELRHVADYLVGSPAEIPGAGAPYDKIMTQLCQGDAKGIMDNYYAYYENRDGVALSVIDTKQMEMLASKTAQYVPSIWADKRVVDTQGIQYYSPYSSSYTFPEGFDMRSAMHKLLTDEQFADWDQALIAAVPYRKSTETWTTTFSWDGDEHSKLTDPEYYGGISMFIPNPKYNYYDWNTCFQDTQWYKTTGWDTTGW